MERDLATPPQDRYSGVRAVDTAAEIMTVLADASRPLSLTDLSERCGLAPAKAHRYLASMVDTQIVSRRGSGLYDLGPAAVRIGLAALSRMDAVSHYADLLPELADRTGAAALLSIWTANGPMVMRFERHVHLPLDVFGPGSRLSLLGSATGLAFLRYLPERLTRPVLAAELREEAELVSVSEHVRNADPDGLFRAVISGYPPCASAARPVLDLYGEVRCVVALFTTTDQEMAMGSPAAHALLSVS